RPEYVNGQLLPRDIMYLSISLDHRVVDGADAARFMNDLKKYLEDPSLFILEGF
ncbi:MAG: 2-oxo acid dehydrogenase subunit E2, partial [Planctomycetota bacterium]|nr:2-oxo acid dehydrogenase subunit E2 [Planctomycetota bacterium]